MAESEEKGEAPDKQRATESAKPNEGNVEVQISAAELEKIKSEAVEFKDKYFRSLAEAENARKRLQKEKQELIQYAVQNIISDFLHPIDHLENALKYTQNMSEEVRHWAVGFQMILSQFKDVLSNNGIVPFVSEGVIFDPHKHEAVEMVVTGDYPPGTVVSESVKGYRMGEKIIRPAKVKVAKAPPLPKEEESVEEIKENKS